MKIDIIAGARPNFIKIAPIIEAIQKQPKNEKGYFFSIDPYRTALRQEYVG